MIDALFLPPFVHFVTGGIVVATTLLALVGSTTYAVRNAPLPRWVHGTFILAQLALAVQAMLGIKLLDQGHGPLQLYIHYVGGVGPIFFYLLYYWVPAPVRGLRWTAPTLAGLALLFAVMAFGIGESYEPTV